VELGKHVLDKELLDRKGYRAGKVDDLLLEIPELPGGRLAQPRVRAIITGPTALSRNLPWPLPGLGRLFQRLLGVTCPRPVEVAWEHVHTIDVAVHLDIDRAAAGLLVTQQAAARRFLSRLPGA
jgi:hypothetical protein